MNMTFPQQILNDTQKLILRAAIDCVQQWGIDKTSLNDIAKQAGVTRPTVYRYFASRNDVLSAALLQSAHQLGQRLLSHMDQFMVPSERYLETMLFALEALPQEPYLAVLTRSDLSSYVSQDALHNEEGWALCRLLMRQIFRGVKLSDKDLQDITEISVRMILSLLIMRGPKQRSPKELRAFLSHRLLPMLHLPS